MAGISVPQHKIFKINTSKLRYYKWDLKISKKEAFDLEEIVPLFQGQQFRSISKILNIIPQKADYTKYLLALVIDSESDFKRAINKKGFKVNGIKFKRFVGTTGGLKNDTILFVNENIYDELYEISECDRNKNIPYIPAKLEAYRALFCSSSQEILSPKKILVVKDCITKYKDTIINIDDSSDKIEPQMKILENQELENNVSDGFSICTIQFMEKVQKKLGINYVPSGVCLRNAWFKGMLYPFPIIEFIDKYNNGNYMIEDIWGNIQDIRECEMITTESSFKLWKSYDSVDDYMKKYKNCGFEFSVTKITPEILEEERELNYQYLQSYDFSDDDIIKLCDPTINYLKESMCGNYDKTLKFLGIDGNLNDNSWQQALSINKIMLNDPYIIDCTHRMIKKKINNAKIGKLKVQGNYQIASGDPFCLMQSICELEVTGLLKKNQCYSKYWNDKEVKEILIMRSPMTNHNNIRKCNSVKNDDVDYWYQYMKTIMIINGFDSFCMAQNGCDWDGDLLYSTNNSVLLDKYIYLNPIQCVQRNIEKKIVTEDDIVKSNINGMGNKVGQITNRVTNMTEVQSRFEKDSEEYKILSYRMACGQLYQQNELDKIKGIDFKPMPKYWYNFRECGDNEFYKSICADKKPYFFIYIYDYIKKEYNDYMMKSNKKCLNCFGIDLNELLSLESLNEEQEKFIYWYNKKMPIGFGKCSMNKICWYIEKQFDGYKFQLKSNNKFDYTILKTKKRCTEKNREDINNLLQSYIKKIQKFKSVKENNLYQDEEDIVINRNNLKKEFKEMCKEICPNDEERLNIVLDLCYGKNNNKQFCWDVIGDLICDRLKELNNEINNE